MENQAPTGSSNAPPPHGAPFNTFSGDSMDFQQSSVTAAGVFGVFQVSGFGKSNRSGSESSAVSKRSAIPPHHPPARPNIAHPMNDRLVDPASFDDEEGDSAEEEDSDGPYEDSLTDSLAAVLLGKGPAGSYGDDDDEEEEEEELSAGDEMQYYGEDDEMSLDEDLEEGEVDNNDEEEDDLEEDDLEEDDFDDEDDDDDDDAVARIDQGNAGKIFGAKMNSFHQGLVKDPSAIKPNRRNESRTGVDSLGRRYTKRRKAAEMPLSHEVQSLLGQANQAYVNQEHDKAQRLVTQVIQIDATVYPAWKVLGEIHKETGDMYKCLLAWTTAAHVRPNDPELWATCARMTTELLESGKYDDEAPGLREQAIYLYTQALKQDKEDVESLYQRSNLFKDSRRFRDAARGFETLLHFMHHEMGVVTELAQCYVEIGNVNEAIDLFEKHIEYWKSNSNPGEEGGGVGWRHINIYGDILQLAQKWGKGIQEIRSLARWLYGRSDETYWDTLDDDREWDVKDDRKKQIPDFVKGRQRHEATYHLPPELRLKLALFRLKINDPDEATFHFDVLKVTDSKIFPEVVLGAGDACAEACRHQDALEFYSNLQENDDYYNPQLWIRLAKSLKAIGELDDAEKFFKMVAEEDETDIPSRKALVDIYKEQGERELAKSLQDEISSIKAAEEERAAREAKEREEARVEKATSRTGLFNTLLKTPAPKAKKPSKKKAKRAAASARKKEHISQRYLEEKEKTEMCLRNYQKLVELTPTFRAEDPIAMEEWMEAAGEMINDFLQSRALYPSERYMRYPGFIGYTPARALRTGEKHNENDGIPDKTQYRGLAFDIWLDIILEYSIQLTLQGDYEAAYRTLKKGQDANIYFHDQTDPDPNKRPVFMFSLTLLACALYAQDVSQTQHAIRWFTSNRQFQNEAYNLYSAVCCLIRGPLDGGESIFNHSINQKYFMRHIKGIDHHVLGRAVNSAASVLSRDEAGQPLRPTSNNVALALLYGNMLSSGTSYTPAMNYLARAYHEIPNNPMVLFTLSLAYLHRAFQAQAENRQYQVLQGLQFLFKYYEVRMKEAQRKEMNQMFFDMQEAEFNVARAFHQIGLPHHAITFYEKALKISDNLPPTTKEDKLRVRQIADLKWESAYNLQLIYAASGNVEFAKAITEKYLVL